jgi:hypothetical protein
MRRLPALIHKIVRFQKISEKVAEFEPLRLANGCVIKRVFSTEYLGKIVCVDGSDVKDFNARVGRAYSAVADLVKIGNLNVFQAKLNIVCLSLEFYQLLRMV